MTELKPLLPCPFCGSPAKTVGDASDSVIVCSNIKCVIAENWFRFDQWNTRAPDPLLEKVKYNLDRIMMKTNDPWAHAVAKDTLSLFPPKPESVSSPNRKQEKV